MSISTPPPERLDVPEPVGVRAVVAFELADVVHVAERALVGELLGADVLRREAEVLAVHQDDAGLRAGLDHLVALVQREGERLVDEDVLARRRRRERDRRVEVVRAGDGDGVDQPLANMSW